MQTEELVRHINAEDKSVAEAVELALPAITNCIDAAYERMKDGGRLFYIGSGTSGRLGILDASECPPTFGVDDNKVIGLIAGGDKAIRKAQEFAEDDMHAAMKDLRDFSITENDFVVGISASGTTPYVLGGLKECREKGIGTASISCNPNAAVSALADFPIEVVTGPEFVTGSTRMKAGTAQKMVLNMLSTSLMIKLGRVRDNKMVDMMLSNEKLLDRGTRMLMELYAMNYDEARHLLQEHGSVRAAIRSKEES